MGLTDLPSQERITNLSGWGNIDTVSPPTSNAAKIIYANDRAVMLTKTLCAKCRKVKILFPVDGLGELKLCQRCKDGDNDNY